MSVHELTVPEFYVEVHHFRGNFSRFEGFDGEDWRELGDVWNFRRVNDERWKIMAALERELLMPDESRAVRVIRYPDLEKDTKNATYHPSVPAWKIDVDKVTEFLNG